MSSTFRKPYGASSNLNFRKTRLSTNSNSLDNVSSDVGTGKNENYELIGKLVKRALILCAMMFGVLLFGCNKLIAGRGALNTWPKFSPPLKIFKQGLVLEARFCLSAFSSMAETSITTLWPWKVVILFLTEITPKGIAIHHGTEVLRVVAKPVAGLSLVLYAKGRVITNRSRGMLNMLGLKGRSEPYVTEDESKPMLRGPELSGAIEGKEQDVIENVLEIKDTRVREGDTSG